MTRQNDYGMQVEVADDRCCIRLQWGDDIGMRTPLSALIDDWITSRLGGLRGDTIHPEDAKPLVEALEEALAKIKPMIRI
jgi:hypothetical protein